MKSKRNQNSSFGCAPHQRESFGAGFTLIEMLVVVAIIGLLSSILLNALGPAKDKAKDARIMQEVNQVRDLAETMYNGFYPADLANSATTNANLQSLYADITAQGGGLRVILSSDRRTYAAYSTLNASVNDPTTGAKELQYYCVDSSGRSSILLKEPNPGLMANVASCQ